MSRPLVNVLGEYVLSAAKLHADDTPFKVLAPGNREDTGVKLHRAITENL